MSPIELPAAGMPVLIEHAKTGMLMVLVPGGKFLAGGRESDEGGGKFEVELPGYYIGMHAVTNRQYGVFVEETKYRAPGNKIWQEAGKAEHPVTDVSWDDAQAYCAWAGLRLPSELEWEKAARGVDGRRFPWGEDWNEKKCRTGKNKRSERTAGVWDYAEGATPYGAYQMSGNVLEWCEDWYEKESYNRYKRRDLKPPGSGGFRVLRGGSWHNGNPGDFTASYRDSDSVGGRFDDLGFRCVVSVGFSV